MSIFSTIAVFHHLKGPKKQYETAWQIIWTPMTTLSLDRHGIHKTTVTHVFFYLHQCVAHNVLFCIMGLMSSELRIWSQQCVLCTKSLQLKLQVTRPLQKGAGNLYFQQTSKEPTSNCKGCIWELWSNSPACWSSEWWSSFPLCRSQSCKTSLGLLQQCRAHNETRISIFVE